MDTEYTRATTEPEREALARRIADLRVEGVPWDGPGGIVDSMRLVSSATQGRALLRRYNLDVAQGGSVEHQVLGANALRLIDPAAPGSATVRHTARQV